jgi:hypothetical protein
MDCRAGAYWAGAHRLLAMPRRTLLSDRGGGNSMKLLKRAMSILAIISLLYWLSPRDAHAYLDPGTGSYILQVALAAVVGIGFAIKLSWGRIKAFFENLRSDGEENEQDEG